MMLGEGNSHNVDADEVKVSIAELAEFLKTNTLITNIISDHGECELDISALNTKKCKPNATGSAVGSSDVIKIGSLELPRESAEDDGKELVDDNFAKHYMNYFVLLAQGDSDEQFNYMYVENLCKYTDVNRTDVHGQSVMHEVARDWNKDVAFFLKLNGVNIDVADNWGRTPLFVAVAASNIEMVRWLIDNGVDRNHRTIKGEGQLPLHYAARYDAIEVAEVLLEYGANPLARDDLDRTPFFLAAEYGIKRMCNYFLDLELPTASYDDNGEATIDHIISNLPSEVINKALNQFIARSLTDTNFAKVYLSCLGKRRWRLIQKCRSKQLSYIAPATLEVITERNECGIIQHPVIIELIKLKRKQYGNKFLMINNFLNVLFTLLWTVSAVIRIGNIDDPLPSTSRRNIIMGFTVVAQIITFVFIYKLYLEWKAAREFVNYEKRRKGVRLYNSKPFCHPRWVVEISKLESRIERVQNATFDFWNNGWTYIEIFCLFLACVFTIITVLWYLAEEGLITFHYQIRLFYSAFFVLVVWLRLNRCFKYHQTFGPFVQMLGECVVATAQIGFLFIEFYLPFAVAFWVLFGGTVVEDGSDEYVTENNLLYQLWLLTFIGDFEYDTLSKISPLDAQILIGLFFLIVSIITFNIYIALLTAAYARVGATSSQRAYIEEAMIYNSIERIFPRVKEKFENYLNKHCAPMIVDKSQVMGRADNASVRSIVSGVLDITLEINSSMEKVAENEGIARKDIEVLEEKFRSFQDKYTDKTSKEMMNQIREILNKQKKGVNMVLRRTNDVVGKYIEKIRTKYMI